MSKTKKAKKNSTFLLTPESTRITKEFNTNPELIWLGDANMKKGVIIALGDGWKTFYTKGIQWRFKEDKHQESGIECPVVHFRWEGSTEWEDHCMMVRRNPENGHWEGNARWSQFYKALNETLGIQRRQELHRRIIKQVQDVYAMERTQRSVKIDNDLYECMKKSGLVMTPLINRALRSLLILEGHLEDPDDLSA
jgi:hypothetical protein